MTLAALLLNVVLSSSAAVSSATFECTMDGLQQVPPNPSVTATGAGSFVLSNDSTQLTYHITYTGLSSDEGDAHIHNGAPGVGGPVVFNLPLGTPKDGVWNIPPAMVTELFAGRLYVNIHTLNYVFGEIRGDITTVTTAVHEAAFARPYLEQNFPNPFNPATTIVYYVPDGGGAVSLVVYDANGSRVRGLVDAEGSAGRHAVEWDGTNDRGESVRSGVYFYRLAAEGFTDTKKLVLIK